MLKPKSFEVNYAVQEESSPTDKQYSQLRSHIRFDSMSSINNDNEFHQRKKLLQDICVES